jgi:hypothetical protein
LFNSDLLSSITIAYFRPTLTEVFPCFFLSCKANARVILPKMGHGPHSCSVVNLCNSAINLGVVINVFLIGVCYYLCCSVIIYIILCIVCV